MSEWISVKNELPQDTLDVLAINGVNKIFVTWCDKWSGVWHEHWNDRIIHGITHWMPLPEPPEEIEGITFEEAEQFYGTKESEE